jgi:hypothetical protein
LNSGIDGVSILNSGILPAPGLKLWAGDIDLVRFCRRVWKYLQRRFLTGGWFGVVEFGQRWGFDLDSGILPAPGLKLRAGDIDLIRFCRRVRTYPQRRF